MSEVTTGSSSKGSNNALVYAVCAVSGIVLGALGSMVISGGGGGGSDPVVAEYQGKSVRASEAFGNIKTRLFDLEEEMFRTKEQAINEFIEARLVESEAKKQNVSAEALLAKEAGAPAPVSDADIESFLASKGLKSDDPRVKGQKEEIRQYLLHRQSFEKRQGFVAKLRGAANVTLKIAEPASPKLAVTTEGYPSWGNPKAPVTIVEISDFQCPFCARAVPTLERIKAEYGPDKVRIVFKDMPLPSHNRAPAASNAAHCANEQGKFWEFHNAIFNDQAKLEDADLKAAAKGLGIDETKFNQCYDAKRHQALIDSSKKEAEKLGIQATPSFLINGQLLQGAQPFERFKEKIDRASKG